MSYTLLQCPKTSAKPHKPYGLNAELEFAKTVIASGWVKNCRPISALIIGLPDTGKSESLMTFHGCKGVLVMNDFTAYGLTRRINELREIKHIVIPDLLKVLSRSPRVVAEVISLLDCLCAEGISVISTYNINIVLEKPIRCGFVAAMTPEAFNRRRKIWRDIGLLSRVIPFFFGYNEEDLEKAKQCIKNNEEVFKPQQLNFEEPIEVTISEKLIEQVDKVTNYVATINQDFTMFRSLKNTLTLVKSRAILCGRSEVTDEDITFLKSIVPFWFNPIVGNDCDYYIIQCLPATSSQIVKHLENHYSERLIYARLAELRQKKVIKKQGKIWVTNY